MIPPPSSRHIRTLKNLALVLLFSGFTLTLGGGITDKRMLFEAGYYFFLLGIPLLILGLFWGRKKK